MSHSIRLITPAAQAVRSRALSSGINGKQLAVAAWSQRFGLTVYALGAVDRSDMRDFDHPPPD